MNKIVMKLDLMHVHNFYGKAKTWDKNVVIFGVDSMLIIKHDTLHKIKNDIHTRIR